MRGNGRSRAPARRAGVRRARCHDVSPRVKVGCFINAARVLWPIWPIGDDAVVRVSINRAFKGPRRSALTTFVVKIARHCSFNVQ
ncbi:hypothetical protein E2R23_03750 [Burkholderia pseudomallei]|uniref:hypothetical protein n=1 Tax=Burkholderia pseudomallei TaxID=28450 RepID=UPI001052695C|nr:hypothetical protein [Burkholderia pseudomallei]QBL77064.1 hypothetical protein EYA82_03800 [Burkholderia pseudomallei]QBP54183.1 hypothetical protein E2R23_03750 [Burkholderia pseudomallei]